MVKNRILLAVLLFFMAGCPLYGAINQIDTVFMQSEANYNISERVYCLEDSSETISFPDLFTSKKTYTFSESKGKGVVYIPFGRKNFWLHFKLFNRTDSHLDLLLELKNATIDEANVYIVVDSLVRICTKTGDVISIDQRDVYSMHNITPITLEPKVAYDVFIYVKTGGDALNIPVYCKRYEYLFFESNKQNLFIGLFAGLIITLAMASILSMFIQKGGAIFGYFALYALFNGVWLLYMEGVAYQYLWSSNAEINNLFIALLPMLGCFFFVWFSLWFLKLKEFYPVVYRIVYWFNWIGILGFSVFTIINQLITHFLSTVFLPYVYILQITLVLLFLITVMLSIVSGIMIRKNARSAYFFLAAAIPLIVSIQLFNMNTLSIDIDITTRNNITKISLAWQILVLFLAMFDQIRILQIESGRQIEINRKKYFDILENSTEAIFVIQHGFIKFANTQLSVFLHVALDSLLQLPVEFIAHANDRERLNEYFLERMVEDAEGDHIVFQTNETYNPNSWMELNAIPIEWEGSAAILCLMNDVSQRVVNEEERKKLEQQLFQSQKLETIGTLAGGVAHEINNILTPILGYSDMMLDDMTADSTYRSDVEAIRHSAQRAKDVVKQILSFSRQIEANREVVTVQKIIEMVRSMLQASLPGSVTLSYAVEAPEALLHVNVTQIEQVILNLCNNASHAIKHNHGQVTIKANVVDGTVDVNRAKLKPIVYVCLSVTDNGAGMSEETLKRIFEPFFTTKKVGEGTGLGLSVVHGIVKNHGGIIDVISAIGVGTQFDIYLPLYIHKGDELQEIKTSPEQLTGTETILVIDDESEIASVIKRALSHLGYTVTTINNSLEAIREIEKNPYKYSLIISDLQMPRLSGRELMATARQINGALRFVILTGMFEQQIDKRLFPIEFCSVMTKPINLKELGIEVRRLLDMK